jgi:hypothetical protein
MKDGASSDTDLMLTFGADQKISSFALPGPCVLARRALEAIRVTLALLTDVLEAIGF